jgi:hypothetical protein
MKDVLALVEEKKQEFARLPFFEFIQEKSIDPRQRLVFAPCIAPLVMGFGELNKDVLREEPTTNSLQKIINKHTYEDDFHWQWFLQDLQNLGLDQSLNISDALRFIWGDKTKVARQLVYELYRYSFQAEPIQKLVVILVVEATGNVMFSASTPATQELKAMSSKDYQYFGKHHLVVDYAHTIYSSEGKHFIDNIKLTEEMRKEAFTVVEKLFGIFTELINALLAYAETHKIEEPLQVA